MKNLFEEEIKDWTSWSKVFQSIPAFKKLIMEIFKRENLPYQGICHLTAGSNAVFQVGTNVIKIFAPVESGFNTEIDYNCEIIGMKRANSLGINTPKLIAASYIEDRYLFRYIIMEHIKGRNALTVLRGYSIDNKIKFVSQLKVNLEKMNTIIDGGYPSLDVKEKALANNRWDKLPSETVVQVKKLLENYNISSKVYVHGDLTEDNVMITDDEKLYILDFADGTIAPKEYEYPAILFDLFDFDQGMIKEFIGKEPLADFIEKCFYGILLHEFGVIFVERICERILGIKVEELKDIQKIKEALQSFF